MIVFVGALRHPDNTHDYARVERQLRSTLGSVCAQTDPDFKVVVVCSRLPSFDAIDPDRPELDAHVEYVEVGYPPLATAPGEIDRPRIRRDKGTKYIRGILAAQKHQPDYVMIFDTDDLVSPKIAAFVNARPGRAGWRITQGFVHDRTDGQTYRLPRFAGYCGTSRIIGNALLTDPPPGPTSLPGEAGETLFFDQSRTAFCRTLDERDAGCQETIASRVDPAFVDYVIGAHAWAALYYGLEPLPFAAAAWVWNSGDNTGGDRRVSNPTWASVLKPCEPPAWLPSRASAPSASEGVGVVFIGALRHPDNASDYGRVERQLRATLRSVCAQTDSSFRVIIVCNRVPSFDTIDPERPGLDRHVEYVEVDFPPPSTKRGPETGMDAIRKDRSTKYVRGIIAAQRHRPAYVMIFDTDDFVSPELVTFVKHQAPGSNGWYLDEGYVHDQRDGRTYRIARFVDSCGTSLIINNDLLACPPAKGACALRVGGEAVTVDLARTRICGPLGERPSQPTIEAQVDPVFLTHVLGSHKWTPWYYALDPLPFAGAVWLLNTGENHGGQRDLSGRSAVEVCEPPAWLGTQPVSPASPAKPVVLGEGCLRVFHYHLRKTAGTSLNAAFWHLGDLDLQAVENWVLLEGNGKRFVRHHRGLIERGDYLFANTHEAASSLTLPEDTFTVTILRDPVRRVVSLYRYLLFLRDHPAAAQVEPGLQTEVLRAQLPWVGTDFGEFLTRLPRTDLLCQLHVFSPQLDVDEAAERIAAVDQVCFTETFSADLARLAQRLELPLTEQHERRFGATVELDGGELRRARELLQPEYELLEQVSRAIGRPLPFSTDRLPDPEPQRASGPGPVAVLGVYRSGSSCLAGALHHLGAPMGTSFHTAGPATPRGSYEDRALQHLCTRAYREPDARQVLPRAAIVARLKRWFFLRRSELKDSQLAIGAKHPMLCAMVPELVEAAPGVRLVRIERPLERSLRSLRKVNWWAPEQAEALQRFLDQRCEQALVDLPHLRVSYQALLDDPRAELERLARALDLPDDPDRLEAAVRSVDPALKHY